MHRRKFIGAIGLGVIASNAGCSSILGPDPVIVDIEQEGASVVNIIILNNGSRGNLLVTLEYIDRNDLVLDKVAREVFMNADERRKVSFNQFPPQGTTTFGATVESS